MGISYPFSAILRVVCAALVAQLIAASSARGGDGGSHLEPEDSLWQGADPDWNDYPVVYASVFKEAFGNDVRLRMVSSGSMLGTYYDVVALLEHSGDYRIIFLHSDKDIASYTGWSRRNFGPPHSPKDYQSIRPERCEAAITPAVAWAIIEVWRKVLMQARYSDLPHMGADGDDYHFWMRAPYGPPREFAGKIWSPDSGTEPGMLIAIADSMKEYCTKRSPEVLVGLSAQISTLITKLNSEH